MSKWIGEKISLEIYGQSHAESVGAKVKNFPKIKVDLERLTAFTNRRKANAAFSWSTKRVEADEPQLIGIKDGVLEGDFTVDIKNSNVRSGDYNELFAKPRPSHADYARFLADGELDYRGGGKFSGRLTAPFAVVGGLSKQYLEDNFGTKVLAYVKSVGNVVGKSYKTDEITAEMIENTGVFPSLSKQEEMIAEIEKAAFNGDSVGAVVECVVFAPPVGIGDNLFGGLESKLSSLLYAIPGVKGVEFGEGFEISKGYGSETNDELFIKDGKVAFYSNKSGGINGGISNGQPITLAVAFRPTPSIFKEQRTVDLQTMTDATIKIKGRHDSCIAIRGVPVVESAVAIGILDSIKE